MCNRCSGEVFKTSSGEGGGEVPRLSRPTYVSMNSAAADICGFAVINHGHCGSKNPEPGHTARIVLFVMLTPRRTQFRWLILTVIGAIKLVKSQDPVHLVPLTWETVDYEVRKLQQQYWLVTEMQLVTP